MSYPVLISVTLIPILIVSLSFLIFYLNRKLSSEKQKRENAETLAKHMSEEKTKMEEILQGIQDGIITVNLEGFVTSVNRKALEVLNSSETKILNKHINYIIPNYQYPQNYAQTFEFPSTSFEGKKVWVNLKTIPLRSWDNKVKGLIFILQDITKEKEFSEMKLDFVAMAAHQLRTPLTVVRSYLLVLYDMIKNKLNSEEKLFLDRIKISSEQLRSLIEDLLAVSRIEQGKLTLRLTQISLEKLVQDTISQLSEIARQKNITITFIRPDHPTPPISIDKNLVTAAVTNILDNAVEFSNPGQTVTVTTQREIDKLIVHVTDHGKGISTLDSPYIFTKFYKVAHQLEQGSKGSGLGLYIAKNIIDAHKGKIWFNSIEGRGSTFSFSLPINQQVL